MRDEVLAAVAGTPRAVAATGSSIRVEVAVAEEAAAAPVVPAVVTPAAVADFIAAVGDTAGVVTSGRSVPRRRATSSPSVLGDRA